MNLLAKVTQKGLAAAIAAVSRAVAKSSTLPVLNGILLRATEDGLTLRASDNEISIEKCVRGMEIGAGGIVLPAKPLAGIVRQMPSDEDVSIEVNEENWTARISWRRGECTLHGQAPGEFPVIEFGDSQESGWAVVAQPALKSLIASTVFAAAKIETRPMLTGALVEVCPDDVKITCIDGVRLAHCAEPIAGGPQKSKAVVPATALRELAGLLGEGMIRIAAGERHFYAQTTDTANVQVRFSARLLEGQYPAYEQIIPSKFRTQITIGTRDFRDACVRASLLAKDDDARINLEAKHGLLVITSSTPEVGRVREEVECTVDGEPLEIAFNARYLIEGLDAAGSEKVLFGANGPYGPCCIKPPDHDRFMYVAMPLRTM